MRKQIIGIAWRRATLLAFALAWTTELTMTGCARLPYTTRTVHEDERVVVSVHQEVEPRAYTHPIQLSGADIAGVLRGFSIREQQRLPLRWFAEEVPPKPLLREDEIQTLAPYLSETFQQLGTNQRAHFEVRSPGYNPRYRRDVVAGWVAVREPYLYLTVEYFHSQIPTQQSDAYDYNYPTPPPKPGNYILYFEPGRFWVTDDKGARAVEVRGFLKSGEAGGPGRQ
ncbi:MAG: hypothetical protein H0V35_13260 [Nitrospira sp.]|nr:hypothetical protein [Nitrospira sp.]